jgi:hypothetical protein
MYNQYIILGDSKPGREQEFDDWYQWVHLREVMAPRIAAIAAQCFRHAADLTPDQRGYRQKFLCLYENSDPAAMTGPPDAPRDDMLMSSARDTSAPPGGGYYDTRFQHLKIAAAPPADIVVEWIAPATPAAIALYIKTRLNLLLAETDILSAWLGAASAHQLYAADRPACAAIYRVASASRAAAIWNEAHIVNALPRGVEVSVACFKPVSDRVTRIDVLEPDADARTKIAAVREAVIAANQGLE